MKFYENVIFMPKVVISELFGMEILCPNIEIVFLLFKFFNNFLLSGS